MARPLTDDEMLAKMSAPKPLSDDEMMAHMASNPLPGQPGVQAIGDLNMEPPPSTLDKAKGAVGNTLGTAGKLLDLARGTTTGPALAAMLGGLTGKPIYHASEHLDAVNPTNLKKFPSSSEIFERAGVPAGGKLSDVLPRMYADPNENNPWYQPEKGGMLDPTLRGTGGLATDIATDPLTYLSFGASGAARAAKVADASEAVLRAANKGKIASMLEPVTSRAQNLLDMSTKPAEDLTAAAQKIPVMGPALTKLATAPSTLVEKLGKAMYKSPLMPIENEGVKYGKDAVSDAFYKAGVANPLKINEKGSEAADALLNSRDKILDKAGGQGAKASMAEAMAPTLQKIQEMRATKDPELMPIADALEAKVNQYLDIEKGTPAVPPKSSLVDTGLLDERGKAITKIMETPGTEAIPGTVVTPKLATGYKTSLYNGMGVGAFNDAVKTPAGDQLRKSLANGLKTQVEASTAKTLGPQAGENVANLNDTAGKLLSTRRAQLRVANQAERNLNDLSHVSGTDAIVGAVNPGENGGLTSILTKKLLNAVRMSTMPGGYGLRKLGEGELTAPAIDTYLRRKIINSNQPNTGE